MAGLAVRLYLGGAGAPRRYFAWGQAVRRAVLAVTLVQATRGLDVLVRTAWSRRVFGWLPAPPAGIAPGTPGGILPPAAWHLVAYAWIVSFVALVLGRYRTARVIAALAIVPDLVWLLQGQFTGAFQGPSLGPWAFWVLLNLAPVLAMTAFHRDAPPAAPRQPRPRRRCVRNRNERRTQDRPFRPPPRLPAAAASVLAAGLMPTVASCSHLTPLGPDPAATMPQPHHLRSPLVLQDVGIQPPAPAGGCPAGYVMLPGGGSPGTCYRTTGMRVTITSAAVSPVSPFRPPPPPGQQAVPVQYVFWITVPAADAPALTAFITTVTGVAVPTLVVHRRSDILPLSHAKVMAGGIKGARLVELEGSDHLPWVGDVGSVLSAVAEFVTEVSGRPGGRTAMAAAARARRPATGWEALTDAERRVAQLVAGGLANREVAERLYLSRYTVETHLKHVFTKLGVSSRAELAALAPRNT